MKQILQISLSALAACLFAACGGDSTENPDPAPNPPTPPAEDKITISEGADLNPVFSDKGGEIALAFTATGDWTAAVRTGTVSEARAAEAWLAVTPASGQAGTATVTVTVQPNTTDESRSGHVILKCGTAMQTLSVTQMYEGALVVAPESYTVNNAGGEIEIEVSHNVDFEVEIADDWITQTPTRALETDRLVFRIAENTGYDNRESKITFTSKDRTLTQEVKIYQAQKNALIVSPTDYLFDEKIWKFDIEVRANVDFKVENPDALWLHPIETRSLTTHTLHYRVDENTTYDYRSAEIKISDLTNNLSQTVTVTQMQKDALVVAQAEYTVGAAGGDITVELGHNVDFTVETDASSWITWLRTRAFETENLVFRIAENPNETAREGLLVFVSTDRETRQTVKITQEGKIDEEEAKIREYLVKLYHDTDGDHWTRNDNWCSDKPINEWYGVNYSDGTLYLYLSDNNLVGSIDLSGCTALTVLESSWNQLTSLNVSDCRALTDLWCNDNHLTNLNISGCESLSSLGCSSNKITQIDLSMNKNLTNLYCRGNLLSKLDASFCPKLKSVSLGGNPLSYIDFGTTYVLNLYLNGDADNVADNEKGLGSSTNLKIIAENLQTIDLEKNNLESLDISECPTLKEIKCSKNRLTDLNVSYCSVLNKLFCSENQIRALNVSENSVLHNLYCNDNPIELLNLGDIKLDDGFSDAHYGAFDFFSFSSSANKLKIKSSKVQYLRLGTCPNLRTLDLNECPTLKHIDIQHYGQIAELSVNKCQNLEYLDCSGQQLSSLSVSDCAVLEYLLISYNPIERLDFGLANPSVVEMKMSSSESSPRPAKLKVTGSKIRLLSTNDGWAEIRSLDVSDCNALEHLGCSSGNLKTLNAKGCSALQTLRCDQNQLTELNIQGCTSLTALYCEFNKLTELDISGCSEIINLSCEYNSLTSLNITNCSKLKFVTCQGNEQLTQFYFSGCNALESLSCHDTKITHQIPNWFDHLQYFGFERRYMYYYSDFEMWTGKYSDKGYGWWYAGEPLSGPQKHRW